MHLNTNPFWWWAKNRCRYHYRRIESKDRVSGSVHKRASKHRFTSVGNGSYVDMRPGSVSLSCSPTGDMAATQCVFTFHSSHGAACMAETTMLMTYACLPNLGDCSYLTRTGFPFDLKCSQNADAALYTAHLISHTPIPLGGWQTCLQIQVKDQVGVGDWLLRERGTASPSACL